MNSTNDNNSLSSWNMMLFTIAAGILVANLYYAQPLLADIAKSLNRSIEDTGYLLTSVQLGYALGVLFIVPLGDHKDRRNIISVMLSVCVISLLVVAISPNFTVLSIASIVTGMTSSATMVVVPYVASHSVKELRGRKVGQVMTGLLTGILLARTVSGYVAHFLSWRWMYVISAGLVFLLTIGLRRAMIKDSFDGEKMHYGKLLLSLGKLLKSESEVRWRAWYGLLGLGNFSILWTGLTFLLSQPPYNYSTGTIGSFGLIGAAGALSANIAGRLGDKGYARIMTGIFALLLSLSWLSLSAGQTVLLPLIVGIFLIDVAAQGLQVTHQSVLYRLSTKATSRITSVFVTSGFIGMSLGSAIASKGYGHSGWHGVCVAGGSMAVLLFLSWVAQTFLNMRKSKSLLTTKQ